MPFETHNLNLTELREFTRLIQIELNANPDCETLIETHAYCKRIISIVLASCAQCHLLTYEFKVENP